VIGASFFERREFEPPQFRGGRVSGFDKVDEYFEARNISCEGGEGNHSYELLVYVVNGGNEPASKAAISIREKLIGDRAEFNGAERRIEIGALGPGAAKLLRVAWPLENLQSYDAALQHEFKESFLEFEARSTTSGSSVRVPLVLCQ
jgi:hypothetical protein